jgi:predicted lipoprotein
MHVLPSSGWVDRRWLGGLVIALAMLTSACGGDEEVDRRAVLASLADAVFVPHFQALADDGGALDATLRDLVARRSPEALADARAAWRAARSAWTRTEAMWFGPVMDRRSRSLLGWWPIDTDRINAAIAERETVTAMDVGERFASTQRGLGAVEYLLFDPGRDILGELDDDGSLAADYLLALGQVIREETAAVRAEWTGEDDGVSYADELAGRAARAFAESLALADIVRVSVFLTETTGDMRLGAALGAMNGEADVDAIPGGAAGHALDDLRNAVRGIQLTYVGAEDGLGVGDLVAQLSEDTDARMRAALDAALEAIDHVPGPLKQTALTDPGAVAAVRDRIKDLQRILNTEVVSLLGISVGFSDNDGDS